ncbi:MAG: hypothetical protein JJE45_02445 [Prolixibacteraceae bacterium]|nr:hypothetical protein [Prolixibacteraceae bacterium]
MTEQDQFLLKNFKAKFRVLMQKQRELKTYNDQLQEQLKQLTEENNVLKSEREAQGEKYEYLKMAKVLSAGSHDKQKVKHQIKEIVREIDKCITQLGV